MQCEVMLKCVTFHPAYQQRKRQVEIKLAKLQA